MSQEIGKLIGGDGRTEVKPHTEAKKKRFNEESPNP